MSWSVLAGLIEAESDQRALDLGRWRFHQARNAEYYPGPYEYRGYDFDPGLSNAGRSAFLICRYPYRLTTILLLDSGPSTVVSWAGEEYVALEGDPPAQEQHVPGSTRGDGCLTALLDPTWARSAVGQAPLPARFVLSGDSLPLDADLAICFRVLSASHYVITYDEDLDVLTSCDAYIDGRVVSRTGLHQLRPLTKPWD